MSVLVVHKCWVYLEISLCDKVVYSVYIKENNFAQFVIRLAVLIAKN